MSFEKTSEVSDATAGALRAPARYLSKEELAAKATADFSGLLEQGETTTEDIATFVSDYVTGVHMNGVDVVTIDLDADTRNPGREIDPLTKAYMESPRTRTVMPEYFHPELEKNFGHLGIFSAMKNPRSILQQTNKLLLAKEVELACKETGKPVAVAEIANKPAWLFSYGLWPQSPNALGALIFLGANQPLAFAAGFGVSAAWTYAVAYASLKGKGMHNRGDMLRGERALIDFEQGRRIFLARGLGQLAAEYHPSRNEIEAGETPQIVALYARAHSMRAADLLVNPHPKRDRARAKLYQALSPGLDYAVRTYQWKDGLSRLAAETSGVAADETQQNGASSAGWVRVSNRKTI